VDTANSALKEAGVSGADRFVSAAKMANGGVLLEGSSTALVTKVNGDAVSQMFLEAFSPSAVMRTRTYNTVAYFVPLTGVRPDNGQDLREIEDANRMQPNSIAGFRWIKHPSRRSPTQVMGHAIVSFKNPQTANSAIANGLVICQKRVNVAKDKKEPTRCMKCQKWGHMAIACLSAEDICGQCGGAHRSTQCQGEPVFCTPCGKQGHPSWDRDCPTFIAKRREMDGRTPDNLLTYFPTDEAWTHATVKSPWTVDRHADFDARQSSQPMPIGHHPQPRYTGRGFPPGRTMDPRPRLKQMHPNVQTPASQPSNDRRPARDAGTPQLQRDVQTEVIADTRGRQVNARASSSRGDRQTSARGASSLSRSRLRQTTLSFHPSQSLTDTPTDTVDNTQSSQTGVDTSANRLSWDDPDPTPSPSLESSDPTLTSLTHD
jgi:hypothetical protein